jgi:hypothetical protein
MTNLPHDVDLSYWKMFGPEQSAEVVTHPLCYRLSESYSAKVEPTSIGLFVPGAF